MKSRTLFAAVVAAFLVVPAAQAFPGADGKAAPSRHGSAPAAPVQVGKIAKATAPDARTVVEVVSGKATLKDKSVTIRGQVVKVSHGILGKNWIHLQDGSGSAKSGTHDVVVTTTDATSVGKVVTASGTVRTDVDIGSGYRYAVLVEDAKIRN